MVGIAKLIGNIALHIKCQAVFFASGQVMQPAAHRPQEVLCLQKALCFLAGQDFEVDQFKRVADTVKIFADPEQGMKIAKAAFAVLDVGLNHIAGITHANVAFIAFIQLAFDEFKPRALYQLFHETGAEGLIDFLIRPYEPAFKQVGTNCDVLFAHAQAVINRTGGMTDLQP